MKRCCFKLISWMLVLHLLVGTLPLLAQETGVSTGPDAGKSLENMINYDYKSFTGRILAEQIGDDVKNGRPIDWAKIKKELTSAPYLTNVAIAGSSELTGTLIQYGMSGVCPPFGILAGSLISAVMNSAGGAIGYESYSAMKSGQNLTPKEILGNALKNIDMPDFIGRTIGSTAGAAIGQALIPIPFVGMFIGGLVGGIVGGLIVSALRKIPQVASWFDSLQQQWKKVGESLLQPKDAATLGVAPAIEDVRSVETTAEVPSDGVVPEQNISGSNNPFADNQDVQIEHSTP